MPGEFTLFEYLPANVRREVVKKVPLNLRWNLASSSKDLYAIVSFNDRFKYRMVINGDRVSGQKF